MFERSELSLSHGHSEIRGMPPPLTAPVIEEVRARIASMAVTVPHFRPRCCWNCHWVIGSFRRNCDRI